MESNPDHFQHLWGLVQDAWHTKNWSDKFKLWFMPTGWRPVDVAQRFQNKVSMMFMP